MALNLLTCNISDGDVLVPIDSNIELSFSGEVEKFSIVNGISIYSIGSQTWTGQMMSQMDAKTSDVKSKADQINIVEYSYSVSGNNVIITPKAQFDKKTKYYIQLAPGGDPKRFLTSATYSLPVYSYATSGSNGVVEITKPFIGKSNCVYKFVFSDSDTFDLMIDDIYEDTYNFKQYEEFTLNKSLTISMNGIFQTGDIVTIDCYTPLGISTLTKITFTTSDYVEATVKSTTIEDKLYSSFLSEFKIVSTIPSSMSVNNTRINPIIIKFNRALDGVDLNSLIDKIRIFKLSFNNGSTKKINFYPQVKDNILKLYLISVDNLAEVSTLPLYEIVDESLSIGEEYKLIKETPSFKVG